MAIIWFTFEQLICSFPAAGAPSDTRTVATNSLPDAIKYVVQLPWNVFMMKLLWVHMKWTFPHTGTSFEPHAHKHDEK